jgi:hypothetical protein
MPEIKVNANIVSLDNKKDRVIVVIRFRCLVVNIITKLGFIEKNAPNSRGLIKETTFSG